MKIRTRIGDSFAMFFSLDVSEHPLGQRLHVAAADGRRAFRVATSQRDRRCNRRGRQKRAHQRATIQPKTPPTTGFPKPLPRTTLSSASYFVKVGLARLSQANCSDVACPSPGPIVAPQAELHAVRPLLDFLHANKPAFLINAAGYTGKPNVDACEIARADTLQATRSCPQTIAHACAAAGIPWGHVSSGCIYSGAKIEPTAGRASKRT